MRLSILASGLILLILASFARAQDRPAATAVKIAEPPTIDGDVLGDTAWAAATPVSGFVQVAPFEGQSSSERTEVRIVYTDSTLYFGVICYDDDPAGIVMTDSRRDSSLDDADSFQIIIDTFRDRQNGFVFGTNAASLEYDGQVTNEGQGTGSGQQGNQQGGSGGGFNLNWDAAWSVRTRVSEIGWSAEFAIPFRSIRYPSGAGHTWGLNFQRNIRRRNETTYWAPLPRQYNLHRLSLAGALGGLTIPDQRNFTMTPYVLGQTIDNPRRPEPVALGDAGIDLKYSLTPGLTLDATYNTDFAQVEVDEQQINLDRFNLFFPEKRPFFLENAGLFSVGNPGEAEIFFSRRIGIGPGGEEIPIVGGARLSGKIGGTSVGFLNMQTEEMAGVTPANNFTVGRVQRELPNRSALGVVFTNRQGTGDLSPSSDYGRTVGIDGRLGYGRNGLISGWLARTETPGLSGDALAFRVGARHSVQRFDAEANFTDLGEAFNPEVGFLSRTAFRKVDASLQTRWRPADFLRLQEIRPHSSFRAFWNRDGFQETGHSHIDSHWEFRSGNEVHTGMNVTRQGVTVPFEIYPGVFVPPGTYDHAEAQIVTFTNRGAPVSFNNTLTAGGFFGGDRIALSPSIRARAGDTLTADLSWSYNDIDLPWGSFITNLGRLRVSYSFNPRLFVQSLIQYNDRAEIWSANLRFGWLQRANTGLFVVYNDTEDLGLAGRPLAGRSLIVKFSRLIDLQD
ncbi:MAG: DUF5916 domain-containing protein [Vicinamibacterales bacterium]